MESKKVSPHETSTKKEEKENMSSATPIPGSRPVKNAKLSLFDIPNTDVSVLNRRYVKIQPFTTGITPVDFRVQAQSGYCDLSRV